MYAQKLELNYSKMQRVKMLMQMFAFFPCSDHTSAFL